MNLSNVANEALDLLKSARIDQAQVQVGISEIQELELTGKEVNLCRTNNDFGIRIKAVHHHKQATVSVNRWNEESKEKMLFDLKTGLEASEEDAAFGIYDSKAEQEFKSPRIQNDLGQALESLKEFSELVQKEYPSVGLRSLPFKSVQSEVILANSNGLRLYQEDSYYDYFVMFSAQDGNRTGSLNYIGNKTKSIPKNFMDPVGLRDLLKGSALELDAVALNEEIKGDVILTPYVMPDFLGFILSQLSTSSLISKSSLFEGRKGEKILSGQFTLKSEPFGQKFATQVPFSGEGVKYEAGHIIKNGVLNHYLLDVYGANRLKDEVNKTPTSNLSLEAGSDSLSDMIKGVKRGLMLTRFSGGSPSPNGDFSGVAKNSFLIENGEVTKSLKEVMISGNIIDMLSKIEGVSKEVINDGSHEFPWVKTSMSN